MKRWNAAAYLRTSTGVQEDPGNTLQTQLAIIMEFISENTDIELCSVLSLDKKVGKGCRVW